MSALRSQEQEETGRIGGGTIRDVSLLTVLTVSTVVPLCPTNSLVPCARDNVFGDPCRNPVYECVLDCAHGQGRDATLLPKDRIPCRLGRPHRPCPPLTRCPSSILVRPVSISAAGHTSSLCPMITRPREPCANSARTPPISAPSPTGSTPVA